MALEPSDFKMHYSLAMLLGTLGRLPEAEEMFRGALYLGRDFSDTINGERCVLHNRHPTARFTAWWCDILVTPQPELHQTV
eukprot:9346701-Pyramimonas_sp.AAC.1